MLLLGISNALSQIPNDAELLGQKVSEVIRVLELTIGEHFVIDEPPGVPRGIEGKTPNGETIEIYIRRGDVPFDEKGNWRLDEFENKRIIGIARLKTDGWHIQGEVMLIRALNAIKNETKE